MSGRGRVQRVLCAVHIDVWARAGPESPLRCPHGCLGAGGSRESFALFTPMSGRGRVQGVLCAVHIDVWARAGPESPLRCSH